MKILVVGAKGGVGRKVVDQALAAGHEVTAFGRAPVALPAAPKLGIREGDVLDPGAVDAAVPGHDVVVSTFGHMKPPDLRERGTKNLLAAMAKAGVKRLVTISSIGVGDSRPQANRASFVFGRIVIPLFLKGVFSDCEKMEGLVKASALDWTIVRPTGLGDGAETGAVKTGGVDATPSMRISRADVARFMLSEATAPTHLRQTVSIWS